MSRALADLLIGRTLADRYLIEALIGRGGMSVVYRATDQRLGRAVAVKVVSLPDEAAEMRSELRERLRREAAAAARIPPHPNVVQVYDYGTDSALDLDFIAMELVRGRDLKNALRENPPSYPESLRILREAARGVAAGHRVGIVHRDVKPANIVLSGEERLEHVKILDFGIAKALELAPDEELTRTGHAPHSPAYASPEQLHPGTPVTAASDVYQLGLLGYELLAGERAFSAEEREAIAAGRDVALPQTPRWRQVAAPVRAVVERALARQPDARYPDAAAFAEAVARAADASSDADDADDGTALLASAPPRPVSEPVRVAEADAAPPLPPPVGTARRGVRVGARTGWIGAGALLLLLLVWVLSRSGGDDPATPSPAATLPDRESLDEEFRGLVEDAHENLEEQASDTEGEEAAQAVGDVLMGLNRTWVQGDLEQHVSYYADRVAFHGQTLSREQIARLRARELDRFPTRDVQIHAVAITFPEPGRSRALFNRIWKLGGGGEAWSGEARQEMELRLDGRWRIVSEKNLEIFHEERG